jgi:hypothetical protein
VGQTQSEPFQLWSMAGQLPGVERHFGRRFLVRELPECMGFGALIEWHLTNARAMAERLLRSRIDSDREGPPPWAI